MVFPNKKIIVWRIRDSYYHSKCHLYKLYTTDCWTESVSGLLDPQLKTSLREFKWHQTSERQNLKKKAHIQIEIIPNHLCFVLPVNSGTDYISTWLSGWWYLNHSLTDRPSLWMSTRQVKAQFVFKAVFWTFLFLLRKVFCNLKKQCSGDTTGGSHGSNCQSLRRLFPVRLRRLDQKQSDPSIEIGLVSVCNYVSKADSRTKRWDFKKHLCQSQQFNII